MNNWRKLIVIVFLLYYSKELCSQQYFVDETSTRLPQVEDITVGAWFVDVDSDEDLDLVVENGYSSLPSKVLMNDGGGYFTNDSTRVLIAGYHEFQPGDIGDIDRDGDYDILFSGEAVYERDEPVLFINDGMGYFSEESDTRLQYNGSTCTQGIFADFDGDMDLDIFFSTLGYNLLWKNDNGGYFSLDYHVYFPWVSYDSFSIIEGDVDGDFDLDIIVGNDSGEENLIYINNDGFYVDESEERLPIDLHFTGGLGMIDIDGDKDIDLIATHAWGGDYGIFINDGYGYYTDETESRIVKYGATCIRVESADVDNDGDFDIFIATDARLGIGMTCRLFINNGFGYFNDETNERFPIEDDQASTPCFGDIDNDGDVDLIISNIDIPNGMQNRLLINISTPDSVPPIIARTLQHPDTGDTSEPYIISTTVWDNISVAVGELQVSLLYKIDGETEFTEIVMYECGGFIHRRDIPPESEGTTVEYYIKAVDKMGNISLDPPTAPDSVYSFNVTGVGIEDNNSGIKPPKTFALMQNFPNPFNPSTLIQYSIPEGKDSNVSLMIYSLHGKLVRKLFDELKSPGNYSVYWDGIDAKGTKVASGIYFYRLHAGDFTATRKMTLIH